MMVTAGYDIGGAHLKVALLDGGRLVAVRQIACALWRGADQLEAALAEALALTAGAGCHAVTMTGELADVFPDRYTGVARICEIAAQALGRNVRFWMGLRGLGDLDEAVRRYGDTASANFLATASACAARARDGLLVDMGSTTTDIIAFEGGHPRPRGVTDGARLRTGELVYTGLTRTPVMGVTTRGVFQSVPQGLARELFATMADVRRVLGTLDEDADQHGTCDGRGKSQLESRARLARCFGRDEDEGTEADWIGAARGIAEAQVSSIVEACRIVAPAPQRIVAAGIGAAEIEDVVARLGVPCVSFAELVGVTEDLRPWATACAPAVSVALLAEGAR